MEMGAYTDATQVGFGSIRSTLFKGRLCVMSGAGGTAPFFVLRNLPDRARREILQTDFLCEMGCSESFASVRGLPRNGSRVSSRVFTDDFGK